MNEINDLKQKKGFGVGKIFIAFIIFALTIKEIVWRNDFLILLIKFYEIINIQIVTIVLLVVLLLCLALPLIKLKNNATLISYINYFECKYQKAFIITAILCFSLFYFGGKVWHFQNIKSINYYFNKDNESYHCSFNIKNQTFDGECDNKFVQRVESLRKEGVKFDKSEFLELVLEYKNNNKLDLWESLDDNDESNINIIYTRDEEVFNHLLFKATNKMLEK